jgi:hypothetical protein
MVLFEVVSKAAVEKKVKIGVVAVFGIKMI